MKTYFVDSFTNQKFKGNPAAVCIVESNLDSITMQGIATEIGFSETAFIEQISDKTYSIRFYTPKKEIPLCGHATLAAAKIIFETSTLEDIHFVNCENIELKIEKAEGKIVMQFPVYETTEISVPESVFTALGISKALDTRFSPNNKIILIEINDSNKLSDLKPDFLALINSYSGINGILVTAKSNDPSFDFHYRYFWPWAGTNEDPVTGGIQTFLTKYWAKKLGKNKFQAFQSSSRTGMMTTELINDKVYIYGEAVIIFEGKFVA
ncbi:PhzF family phenazine biosynthesis protein [Flavihumibacter profundi]|uniref:PhzF family phenazine biosynthesis protein n=1 Tax=Flavihumibacter profundi TaxID=2716883 RepID=UPI0021D463B2|nr:PhzF family phenazine biosynthesis protein [Flavihumibacter profundi]